MAAEAWSWTDPIAVGNSTSHKTKAAYGLPYSMISYL